MILVSGRGCNSPGSFYALLASEFPRIVLLGSLGPCCVTSGGVAGPPSSSSRKLFSYNSLVTLALFFNGAADPSAVERHETQT